MIGPLDTTGIHCFFAKKVFFDRKRGKTRKFPSIKNFFEMLFSARMNGELALDTIITFLKDFQIFAKKICLSSLEKLGYKMRASLNFFHPTF